MNVRTDNTSATRALLLSAAMLIAVLPRSGALAAEPEDAGWITGGTVEVGGRIFIDRPPSGFGRAPPPANWLTPRTSESRAKFEEYGEIQPGLFVDTLDYWALSKNGVYGVQFWAENIGFNNQGYFLELSKAGEHYLSLSWDEIPHLISTSAKTIFGGAGTTNLTVNDGLQTTLQANQANATAAGAAGILARSNIEAAVNGAATSLTLGTQREKATVAYRNTQHSSWDFKVDYSNEHRTGTRPVAMSWGAGFPTNIVEAIQPIDDRTQNVSATAQYVGTSFWGQRWISSFRYSGSFYDNSLESLEVENPFCLTSAGSCRADLRLALAPSNSANAFTFQNVAELPWKSRLANTVQYNMMRQNDPFVSTAINGLSPTAFPAASANAEINTLLVNNVLTTQIAKDVKSKLRYRYYDLDNNTPELFWTDYIRNDGAVVGTDRRNLAIAYTKQNASADLNWRATDWLTVGGGYGWEQYDRFRRDVNITNEHSGNLFFDSDVFGVARMRNSILYSVRRYDQYDAEALVEHFGLQFSENTEQMRKFDIANRDRLKLESFLEIPINQSLTLTPNAGLRNDRYPNDVLNQLGITRDNGWNAGIEVSSRLTADFGLMLSYNYEERERFMKDCCGSAAGGLTPANIWSSEITHNFHTYIVAADWKAIPDRLDFKAEYLLARSSEENDTTPCSSGATGCTGGGTGVTTTQFPTERGDFQRFSLTARYVVDPTYVRQMGWQGEVFAKLRYIYERNRTVNWAVDDMTPYIPTEDQTTDLTGGGRSIFLAAFNPNYDAQIVALTFGFKW